MDKLVKNVICTYLDSYTDITNTLSCLDDPDTHDIRYTIINSKIKFPLKFKLHTLVLKGHKIADKHMPYLTGITKLVLTENTILTDAGLEYLAGISELQLPKNNNITDEGLKHLKGIHILHLGDSDDDITDVGMKYIEGVKEFKLFPTPTDTYNNKRFFRGVYNNESFGRYSGTTPRQAACKAFSSLLKQIKGENKADFEIRECTRGSQHKTYKYTGEKKKLDAPVNVVIGSGPTHKTISYRFANKVTNKKD